MSILLFITILVVSLFFSDPATKGLIHPPPTNAEILDDLDTRIEALERLVKDLPDRDDLKQLLKVTRQTKFREAGSEQ